MPLEDEQDNQKLKTKKGIKDYQGQVLKIGKEFQKTNLLAYFNYLSTYFC